MEKFSIDLKASGKGERKKAVKYLREHGVKKRNKYKKEYSYLYVGGGRNDFGRYYCHGTDQQLLTLPRDWDKLVEIVEEKSQEAEEKEQIQRIINIQKSMAWGNSNLYPDFIPPMPSFDRGGEVPKFKVGDVVKWSGCDPIIGVIRKRSVYHNDCWAVSNTHVSCSEKLLEFATQDEINKYLIEQCHK